MKRTILFLILGLLLSAHVMAVKPSAQFKNMLKEYIASGRDTILVECRTDSLGNPLEKPLKIMASASMLLVADDVTGVGVLDDVILPVLVTGCAAVGVLYVGYEAYSYISAIVEAPVGTVRDFIPAGTYPYRATATPKTLMCGVPESNFFYALAVKGTWMPFGGNANPSATYNGNYMSQWGNWTCDANKAYLTATCNGREKGIVLTATFIAGNLLLINTGTGYCDYQSYGPVVGCAVTFVYPKQ